MHDEIELVSSSRPTRALTSLAVLASSSLNLCCFGSELSSGTLTQMYCSCALGRDQVSLESASDSPTFAILFRIVLYSATLRDDLRKRRENSALLAYWVSIASPKTRQVLSRLPSPRLNFMIRRAVSILDSRLKFSLEY